MPTKNMHLLKGTFIVFKVLELLWEHVLRFLNSGWMQCYGDGNDVEEAGDKGSADKQ